MSGGHSAVANAVLTVLGLFIIVAIMLVRAIWRKVRFVFVWHMNRRNR